MYRISKHFLFDLKLQNKVCLQQIYLVLPSCFYFLVFSSIFLIPRKHLFIFELTIATIHTEARITSWMNLTKMDDNTPETGF